MLIPQFDDFYRETLKKIEDDEMFHMYSKGHEYIDKVFAYGSSSKSPFYDIEYIFNKFYEEIPKDKKRKFCLHVSALFQNVLLNRLNELPLGSEEKVLQGRIMISRKIHELNKNNTK